MHFLLNYIGKQLLIQAHKETNYQHWIVCVCYARYEFWLIASIVCINRTGYTHLLQLIVGLIFLKSLKQIVTFTRGSTIDLELLHIKSFANFNSLVFFSFTLFIFSPFWFASSPSVGSMTLLSLDAFASPFKRKVTSISELFFAWL